MINKGLTYLMEAKMNKLDLTLFTTACFLNYGGAGGGGGIFIPHPRKQGNDYLIDLKFGTGNRRFR